MLQVKTPILASLVVAGVTLASAAHADVSTCVSAANEGGVLRRDVTKLVSARDRLRVCAADDCPTEIRDDCRKLLAEVEGAIPTIVPVAEDATGSALLDVRLEVDGVTVAQKLEGLPLSFDAGAHKVAFVRGSERVEMNVVLTAGRKNVDVRARFQDVNVPPTVPAAAVTTDRGPSPPPAEARSSSLRWVGLGAAGLGVVGLGLGTVFGLRASSLQDEAGCPDNRCRDETSAGKLRDAQSAGNLSTVFFVAGGVLAAGGVTLFLLSPSEGGDVKTAKTARTRIAPLPSGAAMVFEGTL